uniref:TSA: Wollemia nobilis Ref_Wollemi_Transcript_11202_2016 transcribed RNA sequence n=1 Tax=Wollemia nobilis TaxID=56998 RepID=A0A0C9RMA4_9CONI
MKNPIAAVASASASSSKGTSNNNNASSSSSSSVVRNIFSSRPQQAQVHPMNSPSPSRGSSNSKEDRGLIGASSGHDQEALEEFQRSAGERFAAIAAANDDEKTPLLSLAWLRLALDAVLGCEADFKALVPRPRPPLCKPAERIADDFLERSVKALDLCNAVRDGIEHIRLWQKHVEILLCALDLRQRHHLGEAQLRRARKALSDLTLALGEDNKESVLAQYRHRSFARPPAAAAAASSHFRSLSWSVSRSWSAGRQLQAMGSNMAAPRAAEVAATGGFAVAAYSMNVVILFGMWALVAAVPCQDRGLQIHFSVPRTFPWAAPLLAVYDKVMEEARRRDRRSGGGGGGGALLMEIYQISSSVRRLSDLVDAAGNASLPLTENQDQEIRKEVMTLMQLWASVKEGLDPLEKQVRELFHRIVNTRTEVLDCMSRTTPER